MEPKFVHFIVEPDGDVSVGYGATEQEAKEAAEAASISQQSKAQRQAWLLTFCRTASEIERDDEKQSHLDPRHGHWGGL